LLLKLFPLDGSNFQPPDVDFYFVTRKENFNDFNIAAGAEDGLAAMRNIDATFSTKHYRKWYFDQDIKYTKCRYFSDL
jgi:hypothetical protein